MKPVETGLILVFILLLKINLFSYTRIYLISDIEISKENLTVGDICKIEGDNQKIISEIKVSPELYSDSIVDNKELYDLLSQSADNQIYIFGSGVKVTRNIIEKSKKLNEILVEKGRMLEITFKKNGVVIELKGKALSSGRENDNIDIKLTTGKVVKGRILSEKRVDVNL